LLTGDVNNTLRTIDAISPLAPHKVVLFTEGGEEILIILDVEYAVSIAKNKVILLRWIITELYLVLADHSGKVASRRNVAGLQLGIDGLGRIRIVHYRMPTEQSERLPDESGNTRVKNLLAS